ncbi:hypothetical protein GOODEAATRI_007282 [Goodea atripinnis]|uniref:Uncharacterized protein n=1 Tax=Goodea atripinnis TaxID=208336 RepID=A0ABV0PW98_9TELE
MKHLFSSSIFPYIFNRIICLPCDGNEMSPFLLKVSQSVSQLFSTAYSIVGHREAGTYLQQSMGERRGTPWTGPTEGSVTYLITMLCCTDVLDVEVKTSLKTSMNVAMFFFQ